MFFISDFPSKIGFGFQPTQTIIERWCAFRKDQIYRGLAYLHPIIRFINFFIPKLPNWIRIFSNRNVIKRKSQKPPKKLNIRIKHDILHLSFSLLLENECSQSCNNVCTHAWESFIVRESGYLCHFME